MRTFFAAPSGGFYPIGQPRGGSYVWDPINATYNVRNIVLYEWDFDDDGVVDLSRDFAAAGKAYFVFQTPGNYTPRLRITSNRGQTLQQRQDDQIWHVAVGNSSVQVVVQGDGQGGVRDPGLTAPITAPGVQINCWPNCHGDYPNNTTVYLRALPAQGSRFEAWGGLMEDAECFQNWRNVQDPLDPSGFYGYTSVTLDFATGTGMNCVAFFKDNGVTFVNRARLRLFVDSQNTGSGIIGSATAGTPCYGSPPNCNRIPVGTIVNLTAFPDNGSTFDGWHDSDSSTGPGIPCGSRFTMGSDIDCFARFSSAPVRAC